MDKATQNAAAYLPERLCRAAQMIPDKDSRSVREIRLRAGASLTLSTDNGERFLLSDGQLSTVKTPRCLPICHDDVEECIQKLCGYALHTHQEEFKQGCITADGCRAGLSGTVVYGENGSAISMRDVTSVCLRVAREHRGCADEILRQFSLKSRGGILIFGVPSSGKTSLLRDIAAGLSEGRWGKRHRVSVVDERGELALGKSLCNCDVIRGCRKAEGIERAIRLLAPEYLIIDEWTSAEEADAIEQAFTSGVRLVTSVHAPSYEILKERRDLAKMLEKKRFSVIANVSPEHRITIMEEKE